MRTRADIERDICSKRRERILYVTPAGIAKLHEQLDRLLEEWEQSPPAGDSPPWDGRHGMDTGTRSP